MIVKMFFRQGEVFDGTGKLPAPKFKEFIDPDPSHCLQHPTKDKAVAGEPKSKNSKSRGKPSRLSRDRSHSQAFQLSPSMNAKLHGCKHYSSGQLALDILNEHLDRVKITDPVDGGIILELG